MKLNCYIQEYSNLLAFLLQAKINKRIMPTVFDKDGKDIVAVRGMCIGETDASIDVNPYVQNGGFLFE